MIIKNVDINLKDTITCGQIFRFIINDDNSYTVILEDRVVNIRQIDNDLIIDSNNNDNLEEVIREYLDLDRDYNSINNEILKMNNNIKKIINDSKGLKIINSPKFETIVSYIISQNNRVTQIQKVLNSISEKYGKEIIYNDKKYYLFPKKEDLINLSIIDFRNLKMGFRDKYVYDFIHSNIDINKLDTLSTEEAKKELMSINGIGEKVASCILLFAYKKFDVYPIDTWVKKYMKDEHNLSSVNEIKKYMKEKYGKYSGLVIQYIFHSKRNKD